MEDALKAATHPHDFKLLVSSDGQRSTSVESVIEHARGATEPVAAAAPANGGAPGVSGARRRNPQPEPHATLVAHVARAADEPRGAAVEARVDAGHAVERVNAPRELADASAARTRRRHRPTLAVEHRDQLLDERLLGEAAASAADREPVDPARTERARHAHAAR